AGDDREEPQASRGSDQSRSRRVAATVGTRGGRGEVELATCVAPRRAQPRTLGRCLEQSVRNRSWKHVDSPLVKAGMCGQDAELARPSVPRHGRTSGMRTLTTLAFLFFLFSNIPVHATVPDDLCPA